MQCRSNSLALAPKEEHDEERTVQKTITTVAALVSELFPIMTALSPDNVCPSKFIFTAGVSKCIVQSY